MSMKETLQICRQYQYKPFSFFIPFLYEIILLLILWPSHFCFGHEERDDSGQTVVDFLKLLLIRSTVRRTAAGPSVHCVEGGGGGACCRWWLPCRTTVWYISIYSCAGRPTGRSVSVLLHLLACHATIVLSAGYTKLFIAYHQTSTVSVVCRRCKWWV